MIPKIAPKSTALNVNSGRFAVSGTYGRNSPCGAAEFHAAFWASLFDTFATHHLRRRNLPHRPRAALSSPHGRPGPHRALRAVRKTEGDRSVTLRLIVAA